MDNLGRRPLATDRLLALTLLAAGCSNAADPQAHRNDIDPAIAAALTDQLMVDPDLAAQNGGDAALEGGGVASAAMPTPERSAEEITKARGEALGLVGGVLAPAPPPKRGRAIQSEALVMTATVALRGSSRADCVGRVGYTFGWAAQMPVSFPIYPRAAVHEAAGVDGQGCRLRAINFRTPVAISDVADFYYSLSAKAGFRTEYAAAGQSRTVDAEKGADRAFVLIRPGPDGLTEVDLVTSVG